MILLQGFMSICEVGMTQALKPLYGLLTLCHVCQNYSRGVECEPTAVPPHMLAVCILMT